MNTQLRVDRVTATSAALAALARLREQRGPVLLYQSGGCCDGSLPICFDQADLLIGDGDDQYFITRSRVFSPAELAALSEGV